MAHSPRASLQLLETHIFSPSHCLTCTPCLKWYSAAEYSIQYSLPAYLFCLSLDVPQVWTLVLVFDLSSILFTQDARKLGDYVFGTRVVDERPGRKERELDLQEQSEMEFLRAEIRELTPRISAQAPISLDSSKPPSQSWYASVRQEVVGADVIGAAIKSGKGNPNESPPATASTAGGDTAAFLQHPPSKPKQAKKTSSS